MSTLHDVAHVWGQFDDASDDETFGVKEDKASAKSPPVSNFGEPASTFGVPAVKQANACDPRTQVTNRARPPTNNLPQPKVAARKLPVRFAQDVSKAPVHVLLTSHRPTIHVQELRGSSRRVSVETKISPGKTPRVPTKWKAQPPPKTMASMRTAVAAKAANQADTMVSTKIASDHRGLKWLQRLPQLGDRLATTTTESSNGEGTSKVQVATIRAREVETAEVLRSLRQTDKGSIPASKITERPDEVEFVGVYPRPSESNSRKTLLSPAARVALRQEEYNDAFRRITMPPCNRNDKRKGEDFPAFTQEVKKRQRSEEQSFGAARYLSQSLHSGSPPSSTPKSVTPPLSFVPRPSEGTVQGEPEMLLESQRRQRQLQQHAAKAVAEKNPQRSSGLKPALKPALKRPALSSAQPSQRVMQTTQVHLPQFQAPFLLMPTKGPASMPHRQVVCRLPPHLLPPPVLTTMRSKTAVEGFVAPRNVPCVAEDKERKLPITNTGLRKRDVLFFAPLVKCKIQHYGTLQYCFLCFKYQDLFLKSNSNEKREILNNLVRYVRAHGGRFLEWDEKEKCWFEIGDVRAAHRTMLGFIKEAPLRNNDKTEKI